METVAPDSPAGLAEFLHSCASRKRAVQLGGAFSKNRQGGPLPEPAEHVSTSGLNKVLKYEPKDLTISVEAGMKWAGLTRTLDENGQMLALDPPFADQATVGGVVASNLCGHRRRLCGAVRDAVIGMTYVTTDGKVVPSGGMVVKNVAGLDLAKLMIGSLGTLAAITSVNFKVSPKPPGARTFALAGASVQELFQTRSEILAGVLQPAAIDVLNADAAARAGLEKTPHLLVEALGPERLLARFAQSLPGFSVIDDGVWLRLREWIPCWLEEKPGGCVVRVSTRLSRMGEVMTPMTGPAVARAGNGVIYGAFPAPAATREWMALPSTPRQETVVEFASEDAKLGLDLWPEPGDAFPLMRRLKQLYDAQGVLNPGRYYGRL